MYVHCTYFAPRALVLPKRNTIMITNPAKRPAGAVASNLNVSEITEDKISNAIQKGRGSHPNNYVFSGYFREGGGRKIF